jgi:lysozyme
MTTEFLLADIKAYEGTALNAYPDPLSPRGREGAKHPADRAPGWQTLPGDPWTIGYGHTGPGIHEGLVWTQAQCDAALAADVGKAEADLDNHAKWWRKLNDARQDVLANMCFNLGWGHLAGFHTTLAAMQAGDFNAAADGMLASLWAKQVKTRATKLAQQMRTGVR